MAAGRPYLPAGALRRSWGALGGAPGSLGTHEQGSWDGVSAAGAPLDAALGAGSIRADVLVWAIRGFKSVYRRTLFGYTGRFGYTRWLVRYTGRLSWRWRFGRLLTQTSSSDQEAQEL